MDWLNYQHLYYFWLIAREGSLSRAAEQAHLAGPTISKLMKAFGQDGLGIFPAPSTIEEEVCRQYGVSVVGRLQDERERFYAISLERRFQHPAVTAICSLGRDDVLG